MIGELSDEGELRNGWFLPEPISAFRWMPAETRSRLWNRAPAIFGPCIAALRRYAAWLRYPEVGAVALYTGGATGRKQPFANDCLRPIAVSQSDCESWTACTRAQRSRPVHASAASARTGYQACPALCISSRHNHLGNVTRTKTSRTPYKTRVLLSVKTHRS